MKNFIYKKGITHSGNFHADDVFSSALLRILNPDIEITRVNKVPEDISEETIVFDIGFGDFDHHQYDKKIRANGVPYASFGLIWAAFGGSLLPTEYARKFDEEFVQEIDHRDNTGSKSSLAMAIKDFNIDAGTSDDYDREFFKAVDFAQKILERRFDKYNYEIHCAKKIKNLVDCSKGDSLYLEEYIPWGNALSKSKINTVIYKSTRGGYNIQVVRGRKDPRGNLLLFPKSWRGLERENLEHASGIKGLIFCHEGGFLCATNTLDVAQKVASMIVLS